MIAPDGKNFQKLTQLLSHSSLQQATEDRHPSCIPTKFLEINRMELRVWIRLGSSIAKPERERHVVEVAYIDYSSVQRSLLKSSEKEVKGLAQDSELASDRKEDSASINKSVPTDRSPGSLVAPVRLAFNSPWPSILLEMLSGLVILGNVTWVRPFKHFLVYEKQIRSFVVVLERTATTAIPNERLEVYLGEVIKEALLPTNTSIDSNLEFTEPDVSGILKSKYGLKGHPERRELLASAQKNALLDNSLEEQNVRDANTTQSTTADDSSETRAELDDKLANCGAGADTLKLACTCSQDAINHLRLLIKFMDEDLKELINLRQTIANGTVQKIAFEDLWHLYQPGDIIVSSGLECQAYRILHVSGGRPLMHQSEKSTSSFGIQQPKNSPFVIDCFHLDFDGRKFSPVQARFQIQEYDEVRSVRRLEVYPLHLAENRADLEDRLTRRGRNLVDLVGVKHKRYSGLSLGDSQEVSPISNPYIQFLGFEEE